MVVILDRLLLGSPIVPLHRILVPIMAAFEGDVDAAGLGGRVEQELQVILGPGVGVGPSDSDTPRWRDHCIRLRKRSSTRTAISPSLMWAFSAISPCIIVNSFHAPMPVFSRRIRHGARR